ncbi:MAG: DUF3090 domain-containing protein [Caldilineaceae bacterium]|nr:DUF3090 domain-containing protein [Caldilineaceae bacterium]
MAEYSFDLNPVQHLIADAVGEPGRRTFFIQGRADTELVSLVLEKQEVANLAISVMQLLEDLEEKYPDLTPLAKRKFQSLHAEQPIDPKFRVGQLILGYDEDNDMIWLIAKALVVKESGAIVDPDEEEVPSVRFVATRDQMHRMSEHALEVVSAGRPQCPLCGRPIDREGHFCPRTDGEAVPVIF